MSFDVVAARRFGEIFSDRERDGRPIATADAQIAAICGALTATLATRNIDDFEATGIDLIDPWRHPSL